MRKIEFVGVAALVAAAFLSMTLSSDSEAAGSIKRAGVAGTYGIQLNGQSVGFVSSVAGGGLNATIGLERGAGYPKKRFVAAPPDEIVVSVGSAEKPLIDWVKSTLTNARPEKKDGAIVALSMDFKEVSRTSWQRGGIVEIDFPELDAANNKKPWQMELTIAPEVTTFAMGSGAKADAVVGQKSKAGVLNSGLFRMSMPGLDLKRVTTIEEIEVRYRSTPNDLKSDATRSAVASSSSPTDISNLVFVVPEADAMQLYAWHQSMASNPEKGKKTAVIELLSPTLQPTTTKLTLNGVGIVRVGPLPATTGSETVRKVRAECFIESIQLDM